MPVNRAPLDRDRVIKTAIDLLDKVGLDGLSLRRLATELGVQAPALYWHFKNKQELLDKMVETMILTEAPARDLAPGEGWDDWLADHARAVRRMLNSHRDGAMLAASTHPQDSQWPHVERLLQVLADAGFSPADGLQAMLVLGNYVSGFTLEEQADRVRGHVGDERGDEAWEEAIAELAPYPLLAEAMRTVGDPQGDAAFEHGLRLILDGLRMQLTPLRRRRR